MENEKEWKISDKEENKIFVSSLAYNDNLLIRSKTGVLVEKPSKEIDSSRNTPRNLNAYDRPLMMKYDIRTLQ